MRRERAVVVGAGLAGLRVVQELRRRGFEGAIDLIGAEPHAPYDRPPLSKEFLAGHSTPEQLGLAEPGELRRLEVNFRPATKATTLTPNEQTVGLEDDSRLRYDLLFIATGATPVFPTAFAGRAGVHVLRTIEDARALGAALQFQPRVAIVGAGFIGAEVAATARSLGCPVTLIDLLGAPLASVLGRQIADACALEHWNHAVRFLTGSPVAHIAGAGRVERVELANGRRVDADVVVLGLGVRPTTDWLRGSGLTLDDGVVCDATCAAGAPGVFAVGDVARFHHRRYRRSVRIEHWTNASEMAAAAVANALNGPDMQVPYTPTPSFWSDQYGNRLQTLGRFHPEDDAEIVAGSPEQRKFLAIYSRRGRVTGLLTMRWPLMLAKHKHLLDGDASWDTVPASLRPTAPVA
jgi:NADPH-dependent 2,4-dienoyl-CoA reductase/sulfur reductase-like enzyme